MANIHLNKPLSRRTLLRGAGAALALPMLDKMSARRLIAATPEHEVARRLAVLWFANGVRDAGWTPETEGTEYDLSPTLQPLAECRDDVSVYTNLWHQNTNSGDGHYVKCSGFLTGTTIHKTVGVDLNANGISMDQLVAQRTGKLTPIPSLELGTEPVRTGVDKAVGYTRVYGAHISWRSPTTPLAKEIDPNLAYQRMFRATQQSEASAAGDRSLLDLVLQDAHDLQRDLGSADRRKVDEYLESVHAIEQRLQQLNATDQHAWKPRVELNLADAPESAPDAHPLHVQLMLDIIALAFQSDTTRVASFMFGNSVSDISFAFLDGVKGSHHSLSHHENDEDKLRQYQLINQWHVAQFAYLINRLKNMPEGESNVLDNSLILFGSGLRDGNSHNPRNLPILLAGQAAGRIKAGQHIKSAPDTPLSNLYVAMLQALDVPTTKFADSTETLPGVLT